MPITYAEGVACFAGACTVEEAEPLLDWLRATPDAALDLSASQSVHAALVQVILALAPRLAAPPRDTVLAMALAAALPPPASPPEVTR